MYEMISTKTFQRWKSCSKHLSGPYGHTGVKFVPTGGVTLNNLETYLSLPAVSMVGGTWIAGRPLIAANRWDEISDNCRQVCEVVDRIRTQLPGLTP